MLGYITVIGPGTIATDLLADSVLVRSSWSQTTKKSVALLIASASGSDDVVEIITR